MVSQRVEGRLHAAPNNTSASGTGRVGVLACLLCACLAAPAAVQAADDPFTVAVQRYREGRASDAYGRFIALANAGDADAARIALFMLRYGPLLHGAHWDAQVDDVEYWNNLAASSLGRNPPVFRPQGYADAAAGRPAPRRSTGPKPQPSLASLAPVQGNRHGRQ